MTLQRFRKASSFQPIIFWMLGRKKTLIVEFQRNVLPEKMNIEPDLKMFFLEDVFVFPFSWGPVFSGFQPLIFLEFSSSGVLQSFFQSSTFLFLGGDLTWRLGVLPEAGLEASTSSLGFLFLLPFFSQIILSYYIYI